MTVHKKYPATRCTNCRSQLKDKKHVFGVSTFCSTECQRQFKQESG